MACVATGGAQSTTAASAGSRVVAGTCPWLMAGTASDALGGEVLETGSVTNSNEGSCRFALRSKTIEYLEIRVSATPLAQCPAGSPALAGIGNEAQRCKVAHSHGMTEEMVSGMVRATYFSVTMNMHGARHGAKPPNPDDDTLARIADEVAGNLY